MSTEMVSYTAGAIWLATKRFQINEYSRYWLRSRYGLRDSGVRQTLVGRMASCASCAPLAFVLYLGGLSGTNFSPNFSTTSFRASACACSATLTLSVRM